jgi:hypothetical protein
MDDTSTAYNPKVYATQTTGFYSAGFAGDSGSPYDGST